MPMIGINLSQRMVDLANNEFVRGNPCSDDTVGTPTFASESYTRETYLIISKNRSKINPQEISAKVMV